MKTYTSAAFIPEEIRKLSTSEKHDLVIDLLTGDDEDSGNEVAPNEKSKDDNAAYLRDKFRRLKNTAR
jgi:hypothetical protein